MKIQQIAPLRRNGPSHKASPPCPKVAHHFQHLEVARAAEFVVKAVAKSGKPSRRKTHLEILLVLGIVFQLRSIIN